MASPIRPRTLLKRPAPRRLALALSLMLVAGCGPLALPWPSPETQGGGSAASTSASTALTPPLDHARYAVVLERFVDGSGLVNYTALQKDPGDLEAYVAELAAVTPASFQAWDEPEQIAFLLNAYNALTLESVIEQKPLKSSIRDILGVWKLNRHQVAGESMTLDHLEHGIMRKDYNEPRIHAGLVCAAISCPPLRREPYVGSRLDEQLDDQVRLWLGSPQGLVIDQGTGTVAISAIFQWFAEDWNASYSTDSGYGRHTKQRPVLHFISGYVSPAEQAYLRKGDYNLTTLNYDWSLNGQ
ncbi:DUF547 domain-containing protein [Cyanobium sp. LEGE 06113]|uniref:DUF547 domain-containing protein n=1 Tax=Cyanobium sp. LEGE 06113 TaxID=1297573 RepID=UPI001D159410|nr:DUF547 domain-containing protein [Cyanobium sp. LEGE 06113]